MSVSMYLPQENQAFIYNFSCFISLFDGILVRDLHVFLSVPVKLSTPPCLLVVLINSV